MGATSFATCAAVRYCPCVHGSLLMVGVAKRMLTADMDVALLNAMIYTIIETAKLNDLEPHRYLSDVLGRIADHPNHRIGELLPWRWRAQGS